VRRALGARLRRDLMSNRAQPAGQVAVHWRDMEWPEICSSFWGKATQDSQRFEGFVIGFSRNRQEGG
jgi:hypothetical protein